jgi:hypothetical protein
MRRPSHPQEMEAVGTWQRVCFGKGVGKRRDWFFEQVKDRPVGGVPKWLRQSFELVPDSVREAETGSLTNADFH